MTAGLSCSFPSGALVLRNLGLVVVTLQHNPCVFFIFCVMKERSLSWCFLNYVLGDVASGSCGRISFDPQGTWGGGQTLVPIWTSPGTD